MTIEYIGKNREDIENETPIADICYNEDKEQAKADKMYEALVAKGWEVYADEEVITVILRGGKDDYRTLMADYKAIKKGGKK